MSSDVTGRRPATSRITRSGTEGPAAPGVGSPCVEAPAEVLEFIRFCYRRRRIGWPELYDEMCAVAARGTYRGMDYDALATLGIGFSLKELPRLAALSQRIVAEERGARLGVAARPAIDAEDEVPVVTDDAARVRAAIIAAAAG